jgi:class 3 adenylate cyclase
VTPSETSRRLTTILAADVVGYSRLMAEDEEATVSTLRAHREITDRLIARHEGRIFNTAGDSVLAEFGSAVEAVRCAITIQDELRVRNAELPEGRRMLFRIGINIGDVITNGDDLLGDGINVAARLESLAPEGGICISGSTFEQVKNKLSIGFENLGPQAVKNIPDPVAAFRITGAPVTVSDTAAPPASRRRRSLVAITVALGLAVVAALLLLPRTPPPAEPPARDTDRREEAATPSRSPEPVAEKAPPAEVPTPVPASPTPRPAVSAPAPPRPVATTDLAAAEIATLVTGLTIEGTRQKDGQPFTIELHDGGRADYSFPRAGAGAGTTFRAAGTWWTEEGRFCMQIRGFNQGQPACPVFRREGKRVSAQRPNGEPLAWKLSRTAPVQAAAAPDGPARSSDDMRAAEIRALVAGTTLHGKRMRDGRPFTIALLPNGTANLEIRRPDDTRHRETGTWWSEDYRFCMRFGKFNNGEDACPRIVVDGERLAMTKGDGTPLPWTLRR